ncbi:conserved hypothetical protein [Syntrophobacter sp. SbD1]|nr:conserved hypothetical protein [Syntrophobacter sp. SbD1]
MKAKPGEEEGKNWLLIKKRDNASISESGAEPVETMTRSVSSGRTMQEIASGTEIEPVNIDPASLPGAHEADQPEFIDLNLATLVSKPPEGDNWVHEIKYDGYRILCRLSGGRARLFSRNGKEWTDRFSEVAGAAAGIAVESAFLDGEVAFVDQHGRTDFQALQNILQGAKKAGRLVYFVFDIPFCAGCDLTQTPLIKRKELLKKLLSFKSSTDQSVVLYADHIPGQGEEVFRNACRLGLEGIVSKRARRSKSWLKVKCSMRQEFVIGGFTEHGGSRTGFGALLLGYFDKQGKLVYAGKVGTGFNDQTLGTLAQRLKKMETGKPGFSNPPTGFDAKGVHWIKPELVAEVEFSAWTDEGILRHPSFKGLREDKDPTDVVLENSMPDFLSPELSPLPSSHLSPRHPGDLQSGASVLNPEFSPVNVALSNPDRVFYPEIGVTKSALAEYYTEIAGWIMPHLARRPLTLVRCPEGWDKECFFQKHLAEAASKVLRSIPIMEKDELHYYSVTDNIDGVIDLVQIGALEIHIWGSREDNLEQPDMVIFDLDPAPEVEWAGMIEAARTMRGRLLELGLESFVKTTGGKGLHIVAPLTPKADWETVKAFSKAVAQSLVRESPREYIATMSKEKRRGKIFIDYLRNGRGATSIAPYSTRSRQGAPISTPVKWDELSPGLKPDSYNLQNIRRRLSHLKEDPWAGYFSVRQEITEEMKKKVGI